MPKEIKYIGIILFILICIFIIIIYHNYNQKKLDKNIIAEQVIAEKIFENPVRIVYLINNSECFILTEENENFNKIMEKLNNSVLDDYINEKDGYLICWDPIDIEKEVYLNTFVLKLVYSENVETNIIFGKDENLDIMYIKNGIKDFYGGLDKNKKEELKKFLDSI